MRTDGRIDAVDAQLLVALAESPRATVVALSERTGLSRNTVQARLERLEQGQALASGERRVLPAALGYPLTAFITAQVTQRMLGSVATALDGIAEVIEVVGISGGDDLLIRVVAADADDLYRVAGQILATPGVARTRTALAMRQLVDHRVMPLLRRAALKDPGR